MALNLTVIAGPNGSGKTTLTRYLRNTLKSDFGHYIHPDDIAATISGSDAERTHRAQAQAEHEREACIRSRISFSFETVMSHQSKLDTMRRAKLAGFTVTLFFVAVEDP